MNKRMILVSFSVLCTITAMDKPAKLSIEAQWQQIMWLLQDKNYKGLEAALAKRPNLNFYDQDGTTPLLFATKTRDNRALALLLQAGANPNIRSKEDLDDALGLAAFFNNEEAVRLLLEYGAKPELKNVHQVSSLNGACATKKPNVTIIRMLLEAGARPTAQDLKNVKASGNPEAIKLIENAIKQKLV